ncbi:MAG: hypothetical protein R6W83_03870 [Cryobacterium sp.]
MQHLQAVLLGVPMTLLITVAAVSIGAILGLPLVVGLRSRTAVVRILCRGIVDLLRGIPPIQVRKREGRDV